MTHSAGYEDKFWHLGTDYDQESPVGREEIDIFEPEFIRPRGEISTYGNYNTEVLSALVEDVTGQNIQEYFQINILDPLEMNKTRLPLDLSQSVDLAKTLCLFPIRRGTRSALYGNSPVCGSDRGFGDDTG